MFRTVHFVAICPCVPLLLRHPLQRFASTPMCARLANFEQGHFLASLLHGAGSSKEVRGNPTEYFRRAGSGTSKGVGIRLGAVRAEYATDGKSGSLFMRFGERF